MTNLAFLRFGKYVLVGVGTLLFDLTLLYVAVSLLKIPYYVATPFSFLIAVSGNYALSRRFVFTGTERAYHHGYLYFAGVGICGAIVTTALVSMLVSFFGLYYLLARIIVAGIVGLCNYFFNLYINFKVAGKHSSIST